MKMSDREMKREAFLEALTDYLVDDRARMSVRLELGQPDAKRWAAIRAATPLFGYLTHAEAIDVLREWLDRW